MTKTYKFTVTLTFDENEQIDAAELTRQVDQAVSDRVDGWYSADAEMVYHGPSRFVAPTDNVEVVGHALACNNPNDPATEIWDAAAIQDLANYLAANGYIEVDLYNMDNLYAMYDMLKWTRANGPTVELDGELI